MKGIGRNSIDENGEQRRGDKNYNPYDPWRREAKGRKHFLNECPAQFIECFWKVNFEEHTYFFEVLQGVYNIMSENDAINDLHPFHISQLFWRDKHGKKRLQTGSNNFRYDFLDDITKSYRPKFVWSYRFLFFGNESNKSHIKRGKHPTECPGLFYYFPNFLFNEILEIMKEVWGKTTLTKCFSFL